MHLKSIILTLFKEDCSLKLSFNAIKKQFKSYQYKDALELKNILEYNPELEESGYHINKRKNLILFNSNFFIEKTIDNIPKFQEFNLDEFNIVLNELEKDATLYYDDIDDKYSLFPPNYHMVEVRSTKIGNLYYEIDNQKYSIYNNDKIKPVLFDKIIVKNLNNEMIIDKILDRDNTNIICEVVIKYGVYTYEILNPSIPKNYPVKVVLSKKEKESLIAGDRFFVNLDKELNNNGVYKATYRSYIGNKKDLTDDYQTLCLMYGFRYGFSKEALEELENIPSNVTEEDIINRVDLRKEKTFTIDCVGAMDLDDAISIKKTNKGYILKVHIAHVSHYVKPSSPIFNDALTNCFSIYLPGGVNPMLPHKLSSGICSLHEGVDRLVRTTEMHYDLQGNKTDFKTYLSVINSKAKMDFDDINTYVEDGLINPEFIDFKKEIEAAHELSKLISEKRYLNGSLSFASNELCFALDEFGNPIFLNVVNSGAAEKIIENFMVATDETLCEYVGTLPFCFRNHGVSAKHVIDSLLKKLRIMGLKVDVTECTNPNQILQTILKKAEDEETYELISKIIILSLNRAFYSSYNIGHFGLAQDYHTHASAPIRRMIDLLILYLLDLYETKELTTEIIDDLYQLINTVCKLSNKKERDADLLYYQAEKANVVKYMENRIGETFEVRIQGILRDRLIIYEKNIHEGHIIYKDFMPGKLKYNPKNNTIVDKDGWAHKIGHSLEVRVDRVDHYKQIVYYTCIRNITKEEVLERKRIKRSSVKVRKKK